MTQVAAETLGIAPSRVRFELGDTVLPRAPVSGGSMSAASVGPAVQAACRQLRDKVIAHAVADPRSPLQGLATERVSIDGGWLSHTTNRAGAKRSRRSRVACRRRSRQRPRQSPGAESERAAFHSFGAVFTEVHVDPDLGEIRVPRIVATYDVGRRLNAKTARSQLQGGIVWGVSFALLEHTILDTRVGRIVNANLAEYHVPVNADIQAIDVTFVD